MTEPRTIEQLDAEIETANTAVADAEKRLFMAARKDGESDADEMDDVAGSEPNAEILEARRNRDELVAERAALLYPDV